ncbi:BTAD domain-containing putative transcriptional regulator [Micromonospora sp. WMMD710]|uniref:BTAD domain-containing putative transcriptional regulator n=1 Tax=Micromonospora sp. WMMD710 TaxID=3016085 RepID=UPI002416AA4B|nr:BTAD domain-containing putative transcriptional regulator [Micromonospora sp. WMMD710]MDG4760352.1 BTAD domain-containing putative transcriptional regulator [Micromonospora sp. WMMD710]
MIATLSKVARRAVGGATLALLLAGVPYALLRYLDPPLPDQPPTWDTVTTALTSPLTDEMIGAVLTALLWAAWVSFTWSVLAELGAALTGRRLPQPRVLNPGRGLAALLIAMITGGVLATAAQAATPPLTGPAHAHPGASGVASATAAVAHRESLPSTTSTQVSQAAATPDWTLAQGEVTLVANGREYVHTVKRGDTLSKIAEQWLGDANRWPEIFALNRGAHFADVGGTLRNPNVIYPGWALDLPADATPPAGQQPRPSAPTPAPPRTPAPETTLGVPPADQPSMSTVPQVPVPSAPAASPTPTGTASTPTGDATAANPTAPDSSRSARPGHGVPLPTGSWIDGGLALAIAAAVAIVWAHRQRRYRARKPPVQRPVTDPDLAPMPHVVRQIRRGLRDAATPADASPPDSPADEENGSSPRTDDVLTDKADAVHEASPAQAPTAIDDAPDSGPVAPALAHPLSAVWPPAGLGLTGPGADAAARGFLTAALAAGAAEHPDARTQVVIPATTAATLLGAAAVNLPHTPRLTVTADLDDALEILEEQTLHRTRLAYHHEVDTIAELRAADPFEEPLAPVMLLADATGRHERARIAALLAQGQRLDIHGVLLGTWPDGDTAVVTADGTVTRADGDARHGPHPADVGRLAILDPTETVDVLATLAESHTGQMPAPAPIETPPKPRPAIAVAPADVADAPEPAGESTDHEFADPDEHDSEASSKPHTDGDSAPTAVRPVAEDPTAPAGADGPAGANAETHDHDIAPSAGPFKDDASGADPAEAHRSRVEVTVLGPPAILGANHPRALRAKSMELLVYLAVYDGAAPAETIIEDLLPDAPTSKATHRLHTYASDLRAVLRHHAGPGTYLTRPDHRYQLNPDSFDIDLWRLRAALRATDSRTERAQALRRAVEGYRPLAESCDYEWLEPHRHAVQREALDAVAALIEDLAGQPEQQAAVYDTAVPHHPYNEELYQQAMRAHAALGDLDAIRVLRRTLTQRLGEIDAEPTDDTLALADRLIAEVRSRRGPRSSDGRSSA